MKNIELLLLLSSVVLLSGCLGADSSQTGDTTTKRYDIEMVERVCESVSVPVIANGGAGTLNDFEEVVQRGHASAVAAGSMFVYHGALNGILINYPEEDELSKYLV